MTTKTAAIHQFMNGFGIPAYPITSVPEDAEMPYLTYTLYLNAWDEGEQNIPVDVWYRTESEAEPNAKVTDISKAVGMGGKIIQCEDGNIWIKRGSPFAQTVQDVDNTIKRRLINLSIECNTDY